MSSSLALSRRLLRTLPYLHRHRHPLSTATATPTATSTPTATDTATATPSTDDDSRVSLKSAVEKIYREQNYDRLTEKFKEYSRISRFRAKHRVYEYTILRLAAANRHSAIEEIIEEQKKYNDAPAAEGFYLRLISLYGRAGMPEHALKLFDELPALGCNRTVKSVNAVLTGFSRAKDVDKVRSLFRELPAKLGVKPDGYSYNILAQAFCEVDSVDLAFSLLDEMKKNEIMPNSVTFIILIQGFYSKDRKMEAEKVWEEMKNCGIKPTTSTFEAKMRGLIAGGKTKEAADVIDEVESIGLKPDARSFGLLIKAYCDEGNLDEAKKMLCEMTKRDLLATRSTLEALVSGLCKGTELNSENDLDMAYELCSNALNRNTFVNVDVLQDVINKLVQISRDKNAKRLHELATEKKYYGMSLKMPD